MTRSTSSYGNGRTSSWSACELGDDVRRDDVGPRREQLAELDERRAELVEHLAQVLAALRRRCPSSSVDGVGRPGSRSVRLVALEEVAEAVPDRDLRDLGDAPEVPWSSGGVATQPVLGTRVDPAAPGAVRELGGSPAEQAATARRQRRTISAPTRSAASA